MLGTVRVGINEANTLAPATVFSPVRLTNAAIDHTALRGRSFVASGRVNVNSAVIMHGTKSVVPRILDISGGYRGSRVFGVPAIYPSYGSPIFHRRSRTIVEYAGTSYPTRLLERLVRFASHSTVSVRNLNPTFLRLLVNGSLVRGVISVCALSCSGILALRHANRGAIRGLGGTVRGSGRGSLSGLLFTFNVHRVNTGTKGLLTRRFNSVSTVVGTARTSFRTVRNFNNVLTGSTTRFFSLSRAGIVVGHLGRLNIGAGSLGRIGSGHFTNVAFILANALPACREDRTITVVRNFNNGASSSISGGADVILTNRSTNDGLAGTGKLKVGIVDRRRFGRLVGWGGWGFVVNGFGYCFACQRGLLITILCVACGF